MHKGSGVHGETFLRITSEMFPESSFGQREVHAGILASRGQKRLSAGYRLRGPREFIQKGGDK